MAYSFNEGDRVVTSHKRSGEVVSRVPGNGNIPWYYVRHDDDETEDRYTEDDLRLEDLTYIVFGV